MAQGNVVKIVVQADDQASKSWPASAARCRRPRKSAPLRWAESALPQVLPLQTLAKKALEAARLMGVDSAGLIDGFGKSINAFEVAAADAPELLDDMFLASQATGIGIDKLSGQLSTYGPVLKNMGLSMKESIALFGSLNKVGVDASRIMPGINGFMRRLASEGITDMSGAFQDVIGKMKDATTEAEAVNIATEAFGAEGAQRLAVAARTGALDLEGLNHFTGCDIHGGGRLGQVHQDGRPELPNPDQHVEGRPRAGFGKADGGANQAERLVPHQGRPRAPEHGQGNQERPDPGLRPVGVHGAGSR